MILGQTVFGGTYLSPWFPRQGDGAVFGVEALAVGPSGTLTLGIQTKNREDTDTAPTGASSGTLGQSNPMTAAGVGTVAVTGMKELVRFYYVVAGVGQWVHFRVLPPAWRMNGA